MLHSETIYDLIPEERVRPKKDPRHKSKYRENVRKEVQEKRQPMRTMGPAKVPPPDAQNFIKKHTRDFIPTNSKDFKYPDDNRKPAVPDPKDKPICGLRTTKNFITTNAVENITSVAKRPAKMYVDKNDGHKNMLPPSGLEPLFVHKKDYGETPKYIDQIKADKARSQKEYDDYVSEYFKRGAMRMLTQEEREEIIRGLKHNWQETYHDFLNLSVVVDTVPKIYRKQRMEHDMKQLEHDIGLLEKHSRIYIAN